MKKQLLFLCAFCFSLTLVMVESVYAKPGGAQAELQPTKGSKVEGKINFQKTENGVRVKGKVKNLTPGLHGFHIHEKGDCSAPDATSAGGHFNPHDKNHGGPKSDEKHAGDFGNIKADDKGVAKIDFVDPDLSLAGEASILGKAVIVHEKEDDLKSQPTGDAGGRVACGVIKNGKS